MRICVLTHTFPRFPSDPVAPFMKNFCYGLTENKNEVYLLAPYDPLFIPINNKRFSTYLYRYIYPKKFHTLGYSRTMIGDHSLRTSVYFLAPLIFIFSFISLLRLVRCQKIQLISAHWILPNGFIGALVSKITGIPLVVTIPGSDMYLAKKNILYRYMAITALNQAKLIVSNSMEYLNEFSRFGISIKNGVEIPYGVNIDTYKHLDVYRKSIREKTGCLNTDFVILAVGRLVEKKGFQYLIQSMSIIHKKNRHVKLLIIGEGSERHTYEQLISNLNLQNIVKLLGTVDYNDLVKYYGAVDVYVVPSIHDSHGNMESHIVAMFEAFASGLPIVATKLAVSTLYLKDGINGYHVEEKNAFALAKAIITIMQSPKRLAMGKQSRIIARQSLSYKTIGLKYTKLFYKIINSSYNDSLSNLSF